MATLTITDRRVTELQEAMRVALRGKQRVEGLIREIDGIMLTLRSQLVSVDEALDQACEAIYNATLYDPMGERDEEAGDDA